MSFNKGYELKKFEAHWEKLRIEYAAAGMTEDAIQKMYDYDRQQFNAERAHLERMQELSTDTFECFDIKQLGKQLKKLGMLLPTASSMPCGIRWSPTATVWMPTASSSGVWLTSKMQRRSATLCKNHSGRKLRSA